MQQTQSHDGTSIAFERSGQGPALILVGGALSDRAGAAPVARLLAPHYTVYSYDRRGRGASGDTPPYAVAREVEDLAAVLAAAGGTAFVYGHSSGAALALEAAGSLPFTKLALYEPPFIVDRSRPLPPEDYVAHVNALLAAGQRGQAVAYFMTEEVGVPAAAVAQMQNAPMWVGMQAMAHTLAYDNAVMGETMSGSPQPLARWASVTAPTLVLDGGDSPDWARHSVQALVDVLPHARRQTLPGQTHSAAPEVLALALEAFFHD